MTPLALSILQHYYVSADMFKPKSGVADEIVDDFIDKGVLEKLGDSYDTTDLGEVWIKQILKVPVPTIAYLDERGNQISLTNAGVSKVCVHNWYIHPRNMDVPRCSRCGLFQDEIDSGGG